MDRRGVELSMNVIIIAAIALIVLVVLVLLVTNASSTVRQGTGCEAKPGGTCELLYGDESCADVVGDGYISVPSDCAAEETCCFRPFEGESS